MHYGRTDFGSVPNGAGQETSSKGGVSNNLDVKFSACGKDIDFNVSSPEGPVSHTQQRSKIQYVIYYFPWYLLIEKYNAVIVVNLVVYFYD